MQVSRQEDGDRALVDTAGQRAYTAASYVNAAAVFDGDVDADRPPHLQSTTF